MATATLSFELPEEREQYQVALEAQDYRVALLAMDSWLRGKLRGGELPLAEQEIYREVREQLLLYFPLRNSRTCI